MSHWEWLAKYLLATLAVIVVHSTDYEFNQLGNSDISAISVKGKGLTNVKICVEGKVYSKGKI